MIGGRNALNNNITQFLTGIVSTVFNIILMVWLVSNTIHLNNCNLWTGSYKKTSLVLTDTNIMSINSTELISYIELKMFFPSTNNSRSANSTN